MCCIVFFRVVLMWAPLKMKIKESLIDRKRFWNIDNLYQVYTIPLRWKYAVIILIKFIKYKIVIKL